MADEKEREEFLQKQIDELDEQTRELATHVEELAGIDCNFGACIFDPALDSTEDRIAEVQKRKKMLQAMLKSLKECETP
jgi:chaperonin cofactor prefoldin